MENKPDELSDEECQLLEQRLDQLIADTPNGERDMLGVLTMAVLTVLSLESRIAKLKAENVILKARLMDGHGR